MKRLPYRPDHTGTQRTEEKNQEKIPGNENPVENSEEMKGENVMNIIGLITAAILSAATMITGSTTEFPKDPTENIYADCGLIMEEPEEIEESFYKVTITMQNGNSFSFISEDGDWSRGDLVSAMFDSNGTENVIDDEIISCRYSGWISENEQKTWIK